MREQDWILLASLAGMSISLRLIGLYGGKYLEHNQIVQSMLNALPGAVLMALVVPDLLGRGLPGAVAALVTIGLMKITRNTAASMVGGIVVTGLCRAAGC